MARDSLIPAEELDNLPEKELPDPAKEQKPDDSGIPELPEQEEDSTEEEDTPEDPPKKQKDQPRVPQKRFDRVYAEREEFKRQAEESNKRIDRLADMLEKSLTSSQQKQIAQSTPDKWKKILGEDNPLTDQFYQLLDEEMSAREQRAIDQALQKWTEQQNTESTQVGERVLELEDYSESFADTVGIDTSTEQGDAELAEILSIQDELTPTGEDGKYSQPLIPMEVAYEIYKARKQAAVSPQKQQRLQASRIVSSGRGDIKSSGQSKKGPSDPGGWRKFF